MEIEDTRNLEYLEQQIARMSNRIDELEGLIGKGSFSNLVIENSPLQVNGGLTNQTAGTLINRAGEFLIGDLAAGSSPSIQGWTSSLVFSASDYRTVAWTAGTITLTDGTVFNIDAGNTGAMTAGTPYYIYLDVDASITELQKSSTNSNSVGKNRILVAVAAPNTDTDSVATFQAFGGRGGVLLAVDNIAANSASFNELISNAAQIKDAIITNAKITSLGVDKLTSGIISSQYIQLNDGGVAPSVIEYDASTKGATVSANTSLTVSHTTTGDNRLLVAGITAHVETVLPAFDATSKGKTNSLNTSLTVSHTTAGNNRLLVVGITASKPTPAGITLDATSAGITSSSGATSLTISHTVSGDNRLLVVSTAVGGANDPSSSFITGVTYNGVSLTQITYTNSEGQLSLWYLIAPATGTHNVVITSSSSRYIGGEVASYNGVMQTSPLDTYSTKTTDNYTTHTQSLDTAVDNELLVASILGSSGATYNVFTDTASQTERQQQNINQANVLYYGQILVDKVIADAGTATSTWTTVSNVSSSIIQAAFKPVDPAVYDPSGVTYNGVAMTKITSKTTVDVLQASSLWYLVAPATGTHDVVATFAQAHNIGIIAASYKNIKQTSPLDDSSEYQVTTTTVSTSLTTTENNELVVAFVGLTNTVAATELTVASSQTQRNSQDTSDNQGHALADKVATSAGSITSSWTTTHNEGTLVQASFKKIVDVAADPSGVTYNGVAMTKITSVNSVDNFQSNSLWYLIAPATGANNLVANFSANHDIGCIVASYTGIVQTGALDDYSSDSGGLEYIAYTNLDTTAYSELVVSFPAWQSNLATIGTLTEDSLQTKRQTQDTSNGYAHAFGDKIISDISNVVSSWQTSVHANWTITQASFKRIAAVAGSGTTYLACGKWAFNNNDDGFILGREAGVTKVIIGNQEEHLAIIGGVVDNTLKISPYTAEVGNIPLLLSGGHYVETTSQTYTKVKEMTIGRRGDYNVYWEGYASVLSPNYCYFSLRVKKYNQSTLSYGSETEVSTNVIQAGFKSGLTYHFTDLNYKDKIYVYAKCQNAPGAGESAIASYFDLYVDRSDEIIPPVHNLV